MSPNGTNSFFHRSQRTPILGRRIASPFAALLVAFLLLGAPARVAVAQTVPSYVFSGPMLPLLLQMPENSWLKINTNLYSDVWTPPDLEPLTNGQPLWPSKIILAWSSFAWDSNRGDLIIYGGGHANYSGNDVYRWHSSTLQWERASLPSEVYRDPVSDYHAIDGVDAAPASAHTYDNSVFLPIADRFLTWGGAQWGAGTPYLRTLETDPTQARTTGPYLFDPNRADGNKVGGTTGSNVMRVDPTPIAGGHMWENRDVPLHLAGQPMPISHIDGCASYASEAGQDVVYTAGTTRYGTTLSLYRYQLTDVANPSLDQISQVGAFAVGVTGQITCAYDPVRKLFVRTGNNTIPFQFWDLTSPGSTNYDQSIQVNASIGALQSWLTAQSIDVHNCGLKHDPVRAVFVLWCNTDVIWELSPPTSGNTTSGWNLVQRSPPQPAPTQDPITTGVMGKWRFAQYYNVFVGLREMNDGDVWIYKPSGWVQPNPPGNALPTVNVTSPAGGTTVAPGTPLNLTAAAIDSDGTISRVEYYANGVKLGQSTVVPYTVPWTPLFVGTYTIVAIAIDNVGGMTASPGVNLTVSAALTTAILQRGLAGYAGVSDTFLNAQAAATPFGASTPLYLSGSNYTPLVRFAVFQSEGGPVPDGAVIQSAALELYKQFYDDALQLNALLKPWVESQATWNSSQSGVPWSAPGAAAAGSDYSATPDIVESGSFNPGWMAFDVTQRMQKWSNGAAANYGWRMTQAIPNSVNDIQFNSSEYAADTTLRPKLTIVYAPPPVNLAPTVTLTGPPNGATTTLGGSFSLTATAGDADGTVAKVEFLANGTVIGQSTGAPYGMSWTPSAVGSYTLTARATDNVGATTTSNAATVTVTSSTVTTAVLQRGLAGYAGVSDTFLDNYLKTTVHGAEDPLYLDGANYTPLVRFAVFQSEGGPVPNGVAIQSAKLELYKQYYNNTLTLNALLKPWVESQATWGVSQTGVAWSAPGATGAGSDYLTATDASVAVGFNPGWVTFDVTPRVQQWSAGPVANYGWRLAETIADAINSIKINSSEYTADSTLRPKLTVVYASSTGTPTTTSVASSLNPSTFGASVTFTATITGNLPSGTVNFTDGGAGIAGCGAAAVSAGRATCTTATLAAGSHGIVAAYGGDANNGASASSALSQVVVAASTTALASSLNPSVVGQTVTFTASVSGINPTGTVAFKDGATSLAGCGAVALAGSGNTRAATCVSSALAQGTHTMTASYSGDSANTASSSSTLTQVVAGTGPASPVLQGASSRRTHGSAGTFDLQLSLVTTNPSTEPRVGPAQTLVFTFDKAVTGASVAVTEGTATAGTPTFAGNSVIVNLSGVTDQQYVTIALTGVASSDGGTGGTGTVRIGFLAGDANQNRVVTVGDLVYVNDQLGRSLTATNFLTDINASGAITTLDKVLTNDQLGKFLPAP